MDLTLSAETRDLIDVFSRAVGAEGGIDLARTAERDAIGAYKRVSALLDTLGIGDLRPDDGADAMVAAAELCRVAGQHALPYPLPETLAAHGLDADAVIVVDPASPHIHHVAAVDTWLALGSDGHAFEVVEHVAPAGGIVSPFVSVVSLSGAPASHTAAPATWMVLDAAYVLGILDAAVSLTIHHVADRVQFGRPLKDFQTIQFRTADLVVTIAGLEQLLRYTSWALGARSHAAAVDSLAARFAVLDAARSVLQEAHQLHGAVGFTDEHDLSVLSRHVQARLRVPWDLEATAERLARQIDASGFDGLLSATGAEVGS